MSNHSVPQKPARRREEPFITTRPARDDRAALDALVRKAVRA